MDFANIQPYLLRIKEWAREGLQPSQISSNLKKENLPEDIIEQIMQEWKKINNAKKRNSGFICCGLGTGLLIMSFLTSVVLFYLGESISWALYGLTFIGLVLTFRGMAYLFGW